MNPHIDRDGFLQDLDCLKTLPDHVVSDEQARTLWQGGRLYSAINAVKEWVHRLECETLWWDIERFVHENHLSELVIREQDENRHFRVSVEALDAEGAPVDADALTESINDQMDTLLEGFLQDLLDEPITPSNLEEKARVHMGPAFIAARTAAALDGTMPAAASGRPQKRRV